VHEIRLRPHLQETYHAQPRLRNELQPLHRCHRGLSQQSKMDFR
jgi:hypothetical protein